MPNARNGFTLIELILVIAVLGVLAALALPTFMDLRKDARSAALQSIAGHVRAAAEGARMQCLVRPPCSDADEYSADVRGPDGRIAKLKYGYPASVTTSTYFGIKEWITVSNEFSVVEIGSPSHRTEFRYADAPTPESCAVTYRTGTLTGPQQGPPAITVITSGC